MSDDPALGNHKTLSQVAELWQCSAETIRKLVMYDPRVLKLVGPSGKTSYRIPDSVIRELHTELAKPRKQPQLVKTK